MHTALTPLIKGSQIRPLLAMSAAKTSLLTTYLALKRLLLKAKVEPTIVNMVDPSKPAQAHSTTPTSLSDCAKYFLNYDVFPIHITAPMGMSARRRPLSDWLWACWKTPCRSKRAGPTRPPNRIVSLLAA